MKKLLLLPLAFSIFFSTSFAQDWAPFKTSDTIRHYLSFYSLGRENQIQTVAQDTSYTDSNSTTIIFKRGFSKTKFLNYNQLSYGQKIKGQVLGDTAWITSDSSIFSSIDSFGYRLYFPQAYQINNQFTIAVNHNSSLRVSVDSLYTDTINGALDSLAFLFLKAYDSANTSNPNHYLDSAELVISKKKWPY